MDGGIDPGFSTQLLPFVPSAVSERIDHLTIYEVRDYHHSRHGASTI